MMPFDPNNFGKSAFKSFFEYFGETIRDKIKEELLSYIFGNAPDYSEIINKLDKVEDKIHSEINNMFKDMIFNQYQIASSNIKNSLCIITGDKYDDIKEEVEEVLSVRSKGASYVALLDSILNVLFGDSIIIDNIKEDGYVFDYSMNLNSTSLAVVYSNNILFGRCNPNEYIDQMHKLIGYALFTVAELSLLVQSAYDWSVKHDCVLKDNHFYFTSKGGLAKVLSEYIVSRFIAACPEAFSLHDKIFVSEQEFHLAIIKEQNDKILESVPGRDPVKIHRGSYGYIARVSYKELKPVYADASKSTLNHTNPYHWWYISKVPDKPGTVFIRSQNGDYYLGVGFFATDTYSLNEMIISNEKSSNFQWDMFFFREKEEAPFTLFFTNVATRHDLDGDTNLNSWESRQIYCLYEPDKHICKRWYYIPFDQS